MELTQAQYERIAPLLLVQRGNVKLPNLQVLNAMFYTAEQDLPGAHAAGAFGLGTRRSTCGSTAGPSKACWSAFRHS